MPRKKTQLDLTFRPADELIPYARNSRTHSDAQIDSIVASMAEFGWTVPVLVDDEGNVTAGHARIAAARRLWESGRDIANVPKGMVPTICLGHLTETQRRAYIIADNRLAEHAGWDEAMLGVEFADLADAGFDLGLTGWAAEEVDRMVAAAGMVGEGLVDEDDAPPAPEHPISRTGDLWLCGAHRVLCGDSTSADDVARLLGGVRPHLMVTDPPYGVEYDPSWRGSTKRTGKVQNDDRMAWAEAWSLFPGDVAYVWHGHRQCPVTAQELEGCGFDLRALIVWAKERAPMSRGDYHHQHETCWYAVRNRGHWAGSRKETTLWKIGGNRDEQKTNHGTQKPVECMRRPIVNNSSPGQAVYDPFLGSGTSVIAAETERRVCFGLELSPAYVDVIVRRWQAFTGQAATLDGDGRSFEEVARGRAPE